LLDSDVRSRDRSSSAWRSPCNVERNHEAPRLHTPTALVVKGLRAAVLAFWAAGIREIYIDGSFCTEKPDPGDIDGYWLEPDPEVYDRIDPYWISPDLIFVPLLGKRRWRMWAEHGVEFFIHPAMQASPGMDFPTFFRQDRDGRPRGVIHVVRD